MRDCIDRTIVVGGLFILLAGGLYDVAAFVLLMLALVRFAIEANLSARRAL
jgi:hypothetical protein